jgi:hypothetical protein
MENYACLKKRSMVVEKKEGGPVVDLEISSIGGIFF